MTGGPPPDELRARERRALNTLTLDEQPAEASRESVSFACECGAPTCNARVRLTPGEFAAFRRNFRAFIVAPGHDVR